MFCDEPSEAAGRAAQYSSPPCLCYRIRIAHPKYYEYWDGEES